MSSVPSRSRTGEHGVAVAAARRSAAARTDEFGRVSDVVVGIDRHFGTAGYVAALFGAARETVPAVGSGLLLRPFEAIRRGLEDCADAVILQVPEPERQWIHAGRGG